MKTAPFFEFVILWESKKFLLLNSKEPQNCFYIAMEAQKERVGRSTFILTPSSLL